MTSKRRIMVEGLATLRRAALFLIGSGQGCDARFNGEPRDIPFAERLDRIWKASAKQAKQAKRVWGARTHDN